MQHRQGIGARSEEETLSNNIRHTTECCKDDTNLTKDSHRQANSQEKHEHVHDRTQHTQSACKEECETETETESDRETSCTYALPVLHV